MRELLSLELAPDALAPRRARRALDEELDDAEPRVRERVGLLLSELVTNAVVHAHLDSEAQIRVRLRRSADAYRVEVEDPGVGFRPGQPDRPPPDSADGRGLYLVAAVADQWGAEDDGGCCVWFEVSAAP